jgi:hypothetical protein
MANLKISQLTPGAPAIATDVIPIDRAGANFSLQVSDINSGLAPLASPNFTGVVTLPVGAAGTPSLAFTGDLTTGIFHNAASTVDFAIAGVRRFSIGAGTVSIFAGSPTIFLSGNSALLAMGASNDAGVSRLAANSVAIGNGTAGNASGAINVAKAVVSGATWSSGAVTPNTNVVGSIGDLYTWQGGTTTTTLWVKESGAATNTGWVPK